MDGRVQLPVIGFLKKYFSVHYVDVVSEPGPNRILAEQSDSKTVKSILNRVNISVQKHRSKGIAIVGHYDCAGNPSDKSEQISHLQAAISFLRKHYSEIEIIGLWVDENWYVNEIPGNNIGRPLKNAQFCLPR
jgi:hypothetical protein